MIDAGSLTILGAIVNDGALGVVGDALTVNGAVTGSGKATIAGGTLDFMFTFTQNVGFSVSGELELGRSQSYTGTVFGFSRRGQTSLDLADIAFVNSSEASYSGTASGGVLTVTDGTHTAHITLHGDYLGSIFTASSDGRGGTIVVDPTTPAAQIPPPHQFIAAMARLGASSASVSPPVGPAWHESLPLLTSPRTQMA